MYNMFLYCNVKYTFTRNHSTMRYTILCDFLLARYISDPLAIDGIDEESTDNDFSIRHQTAEIVDFYERL